MGGDPVDCGKDRMQRDERLIGVILRIWQANPRVYGVTDRRIGARA